MRYACLWVLSLNLTLLVSCSKPPAVLEATPEARVKQIPSADPQKYARVKDMKTWRNPYLIIRVDGVGLLDVGDNLTQILNPDKLTEALANLPPSAWPYGRVVAVQEMNVPGSAEEKARFLKNRALVAGTLKDLDVVITWVTSSC
jgi:hypothetical protein